MVCVVVLNHSPLVMDQCAHSSNSVYALHCQNEYIQQPKGLQLFLFVWFLIDGLSQPNPHLHSAAFSVQVTGSRQSGSAEHHKQTSLSSSTSYPGSGHTQSRHPVLLVLLVLFGTVRAASSPKNTAILDLK